MKAKGIQSKTKVLLLCSMLSMASASVLADTLVLKDGQTLQGTLVSRDANNVVFDIGGQQLSFKADSVKSISFGDSTTEQNTSQDESKASAGSSSAAQAESATPAAVTVPAGTRFVVATNTAINSKQHKAGYKFKTRLEADIVVNGKVIIKRGSTVYGQVSQAKQSGRLIGKSSMEIVFNEVMIDNQLHPLQSSKVQAVVEGTGGTTAKRTARAAAIGGLINGSDGAKDGAKVGLGVSLLTSGNSINIPAGTMLEFQLAVPFTAN